MRFDKYAAELRLAKRAARHECPLSRFWMTANENDNGLERVKSRQFVSPWRGVVGYAVTAAPC
jgi:hypothetical protein